jgi:asparagine synthase (glutamine-hydrolysing)
MCGITGIYGLERLPNPEATIRKMTTALAHRGPNAEGYYLGKNAVLGHRRLSIIDLSQSANQPLTSSDGRYTLVYNGELYNYLELKAAIPEYPFVTSSDTEVMLAALIKWGMKALQLFNGMFAFAFWDNHEEKLWIARDRMGIKPLYYALNDQSVVFASELRSVLASDLVERRINQLALDDYLRYQTVHAPATMVKDVKLLLPGTYWELSDPEASPIPYWKPWQKLHFERDQIKVQKDIREKLTAAVERRMVSDVPFGAFLSGGIDSSLVTGIIRERLNLPLDTFNVSFDESDFSESQYARLIAKRFNTNHHEIKLKPTDFLHALPDALHAMDHPSGDGPNTWIVSRETKKQGIDMAISGLGGDEVFAGYDVFKRIPYVADRNWILSFPKALRNLIGTALTLTKPGVQSNKTKEILMADYFDLLHLYPTFRKTFLDKQVSKLLNTKLGSNQVAKIITELETYHEFGQLPTLSRISVAEFSTYLQNTLLRDTDQMSMAHALEVRVPFLDHELVEYVMHVSDGIKYPTTPKKLLVDSFADLLPSEIVNRPKMGFVLPWEHWLRDELKDFATDALNLLSDQSLLNAQGIEEAWKRFQKGDASITWSRIWPLITLAAWMKNNHVN